MDPIESIEVAPSVENGNISVETETPSVPPEPVLPPVEETVEPTVPEVESEVKLYDLPDGRKVDGETLAREWKDNFLPEFTRKSQALAAKEKEPLQTQQPYESPDWTPQSYSELLQLAEQRALQAVEAKEQARMQELKALEDSVASQLNQVKSVDPKVDENQLFEHATKYGFKDLSVAYQNMKDMRAMAKAVQQTTVKNIAKRVDPVSVTPGATGNLPDRTAFSTARDYLRSLS
jgi:uncharacterized protein YnzC (UPF0291/DUF896 family)